MTRDRLLERVRQLIEQGQAVLATKYETQYFYYVDHGKMTGFRSAAMSFIDRVFGKGHVHFKEFDSSTNDFHPEDAQQGIAILEAVRDEIEGDWLFTFKGLVTAEVFADFLEMAEYLLKQNYKDPAAVVAGSTLEEHLRQLCRKYGIPTEIGDKPKKADTMNADLAKAEVYSKLDQKAVTTWLDLRNKAAHGHYDEYNQDQVRGMIAGVTEFMARVAV